MNEPSSLFERAGGTPFFEALVPLDVVSNWGGPTTYDEERGQPRLRMRHAAFAIGSEARDQWLSHMRAAIVQMAPPADIAADLERYFGAAAEAMRNRA